MNHWTGLRDNLQETMGFPVKYGVCLQIYLEVLDSAAGRRVLQDNTEVLDANILSAAGKCDNCVTSVS